MPCLPGQFHNRHGLIPYKYVSILKRQNGLDHLEAPTKREIWLWGLRKPHCFSYQNTSGTVNMAIVACRAIAIVGLLYIDLFASPIFI